jgi:hypothetical protein
MVTGTGTCNLYLYYDSHASIVWSLGSWDVERSNALVTRMILLCFVCDLNSL